MKHWQLWPAVMCIAVVTAWWVNAAPLAPGRARPLSPEAQSLAGLKRVQVQVTRLPSLLVDAGVTPDGLTKIVRDRLVKAGIKVGDQADLPRIVMRLLAATDIAQPQAVSYCIVIAVHQSVTVERLDQRMTVPTATVSHVVLTTRKQTKQSVRRQVRTVVDSLGRFIHSATIKPAQ